MMKAEDALKKLMDTTTAFLKKRMSTPAQTAESLCQNSEFLQAGASSSSIFRDYTAFTTI